MRCRAVVVALAILWCGVSVAAGPEAAGRVFDIRRYGAVPDGKTLCTGAIQKAIDAASDSGGGTVYLPPGRWLTGTIVLRSHVTLELDAGCTLLGSTDPAHYPHHVPKLRSYTDRYVRQALIYGEGLEHVTIRGDGTIDGNGQAKASPCATRPCGCSTTWRVNGSGYAASMYGTT
jgi:polygalacturonase